jgi:hypothetical protein
MMKQQQGEYLGSILTGLFEGLGAYVRPDAGDMMLDDVFERALSTAVKDNDAQFPPDFRLSRSARAEPE